MSVTSHVDPFCREALAAEDQWPTILTLPGLGPQRTQPLNAATELLSEALRRVGPDQPCLVTDTEVWSYGRLDLTSNQIARTLQQDLGVVPGNRVLLRGFNSPWTVAMWFGVLKAGGVVVTTVPLLRKAELQAIVDVAAPSVALCDARLLAELDGLDAPGLRIAAYGSESAGLLPQVLAQPVEFEPVATAADEVALLAFTSGSTGRPKAAAHFHRDLIAIAETFSREILKPDSSDVFAGSPSIGFTFGLGGLVVFPIHAGARVVLLERANPAALVDAVERHRVTVLFTAPTAYRAVLGLLPGRDLGSLRRCVSAGEPLDADTWHAFHRATGVRLIDGIGATELLHIFISAADEDIRPGTVGRVVPGYEARIVDDTGAPVPDGTVGHLEVRGPTGCRYLSDPRQAQYVRDGWNLTGDLFSRDADGYFRFHSRADDMIVSSGYNISGAEVEAALLSHPHVLEAAVVGLPDPDRGQIVTAYVVLRPEGAATTAVDLQDHVKARIAPYKRPRRVEFRSQLPKTPTGKITRFQLRGPVPGVRPTAAEGASLSC